MNNKCPHDKKTQCQICDEIGYLAQLVDQEFIKL